MPQGKALFKATTPDGQVVYRSSAREYTHALAVFRADRPAKPYIQRGDLVDEQGGTPPEGAFDIKPTEYKLVTYDDGSPMITYSIERMTKATLGGWGIFGFSAQPRWPPRVQASGGLTLRRATSSR